MPAWTAKPAHVGRNGNEWRGLTAIDSLSIEKTSSLWISCRLQLSLAIRSRSARHEPVSPSMRAFIPITAPFLRAPPISRNGRKKDSLLDRVHRPNNTVQENSIVALVPRRLKNRECWLFGLSQYVQTESP